MRSYKDWDCRLLPMMGDLISNPLDSVRALLFLKEKFGLTRFCMMPEFDCETDSVSAFLLNREKSYRALMSVLPSTFQITLGAAATITPGLSQVSGIHKILLPKTDLLPVRLPFFSSDAVAKEFNQLLYHFPHKLLLLSFDAYLNFYPKSDLDRWVDLPNVTYQFNYRALECPEARVLLKKLLARRATVLFGTGINSYGKACYYELDRYLALADQYFDDYQRDVLFFPKQISIR